MLLLTLAAFGGGYLWAILGIGFLIFIHEYGHYTACRMTGTRVETFSVGFGPRLFGWERTKEGRRSFTWGRRRLDPDHHAMDFRVALIPLGGYVKMAGENPGQPRSGAPDEFASQSIAERMLIVCAGVIMNAVTAFVFYAAAIHLGIEKDAPVVGTVEAGMPAWAAGLETGDRVLEVDGQHVLSFTDVRVEAALLPRDEDRPLLVERGGQRLELRIRGQYNDDLGLMQIGVLPAAELRLGSGADLLTVAPSDTVEVDGIPARGGAEVLRLVDQALTSGTQVTVRTPAGRTLTYTAAPPPPGEPQPEPQWKVGLTAHGPLVVDLVRGVASGLAAGDELLAARAGEGRLPLDERDALQRLPWRTERVDALVVRRAGVETEVPLTGVTDRGAVAGLVRSIGLRPAGPVVAPLPEGYTYFDAGARWRYPSIPAADQVQPGDRVLAVDGKDITTFAGLLARLQAHGGSAPLTLRVAGPDGQAREVTLTPVAVERVGVLPVASAPARAPVATEGLLDSLGQGGERLWREVRNTFRTIGSFFSGSLSFQKNIAGPITLVNASSKASEQSLLDLLWFLAYVSVMLAVLNILPIPVLDGGHMLFLLIEKVRGRPLSDEAIGRMQLVGMLLLLTLMVFAISNDISLNF